MSSTSTNHERSQETARLARVYAQNRSLGVVVALLAFTALSAGIFILSYVAGMAYRDGNLLLFWTCIVALVPVLAAVTYLSVPQWGGRRFGAFTLGLYREGNVYISIPNQERRQRIALVLGMTFGSCVLVSVLLGFLGFFPPKYAQPVSALYAVPFLVVLNFLMRPAVSHVALLWPILYGLHAILIVAGVPIAFTGPLESLNIILPMAGYGIVAALLGHAYNRHALRRLRQTTRTGGV